MNPMDELFNSFTNKELLQRALTHKSYAYENLQGHGYNERLEFLGDAVLDLIMTQALMEEFPLDEEGALSKKRASLVNEAVLAEQAKSLRLDESLRLGKGEAASGGIQRSRILCSTYEAVLGAYFTEHGYDKTKVWVLGHFASKMSELSQSPDFALDFKSRLQEYSQSMFKVTPTYTVLEEKGPAHQRAFTSEVAVLTNRWAGEGSSKKAAEQAAAKLAYLELTEKFEDQMNLLQQSKENKQKLKNAKNSQEISISHQIQIKRVRRGE